MKCVNVFVNYNTPIFESTTLVLDRKRSQFYLILLQCIIVATSLLLEEAFAYTIDACVQPSQFSSENCNSFSGNNPSVVTNSDSAGNAMANSNAAPFQLSASTSAADTGTTVPQATAFFSDVNIIFDEAEPLIDLLPAESDKLDILLNFDVDASLITNTNPGPFAQAVTTVNAQLVVTSFGFFNSLNGNANIINGPSDHSFSNRGFFSGLPENGGVVNISMPVTLSPLSNEGLTLNLSGHVGSSSLALQEGFSNSSISISLSDSPNLLTLVNGTPLANLGVTFTLVPNNKTCTLDADGNGSLDALTDGLVFIRYLFGIRGESLVENAAANDCTNCTAAELEPIVEQCGTEGISDIDGNGQVDALTDGLLIIRYLFGIRGDSLIEGSVANDCSRCTILEIETYLQGLTT